MREFLTLNDFFKNHKWYYIFGILGLIAVDFLQLIPPQILGSLANTLFCLVTVKSYTSGRCQIISSQLITVIRVHYISSNVSVVKLILNIIINILH
jgi:ABC-type multidrug transport system fused ATPase/permease subunit